MAATIMAIVATQSLYVMRSSYARCIYIFRNAFNSGAGNIFNQRCLVVLFLVDSQEDVIAINILYKSTVLPVRLRHAADHTSLNLVSTATPMIRQFPLMGTNGH